ncbi:hypothetical protein BJ165DRAFT_722344 [Panaeolus papilionaceus]|nr:hypothetical protein BJ165DRAFT_722344 [Panaeolus papilionaceus]
MPLKPEPTFVNTHAPGATPPVPGAPVLPPALALTGWPAPDKVPPIDSPEVKEWLKELDGYYIPNIRPTKGSECALDPEAAADAAARGWWTCGGYTRSTDITHCPNKLQWGVSFDDGPAPHTPRLLQKLKELDVRATFFVVGSRLLDRYGMVVDEYMNGHEISIHTWSHTGLTTLTNEQIVAELGWTRKIIKAAIGVTPTTMRPPRGDIDDRVRAISLAMGLVPILWTATPDGGKFDTFDWRVVNGDFAGDGSFKVFQEILNKASTFNTGIITLQHDLFEATVDLAVGYTLDAAIQHNPKFSLEPIGSCLNIPTGNLYWETNKNESFPHRNHTVDITGDDTFCVPTLSFDTQELQDKPCTYRLSNMFFF